MSTYYLKKIDPALWRRVRAYCALAGCTPEKKITELLKQWVDRLDSQGVLPKGEG